MPQTRRAPTDTPPIKQPAKRPTKRGQHNQLLKRFNIARRLGLCYVNNPKVASSTIKLCLQRAELDDPSYMPRVGVHHRPSSPLLTWPEVRDLDLSALLARCFVFSFVRSPFDRLRAVYINKILHPRAKGAFRIRAGFAAERPPSFAAFITAITDQDPALADPHWRPQYLNLNCDNIRYDRIGKLENFAQDWRGIAAAHGLPIALERMGRRTTTIEYPEVVFTDAIVARICRAYRQDFQRFGYAETPNQSAFAGATSLG